MPRTSRGTAVARWVGATLVVTAIGAHADRTPQVTIPCNMEFPTDILPVDYRSNRAWIKGVERHHFTPQVENLVHGESGFDVGGDLEFMLKRAPNHHRALVSLSMLAQRMKGEVIPGMQFLTSCYFERAIYFRQDDPIVRVLYALHLNWLKNVPAATRQLELASHWAASNPMTHYNIGLAYLNIGNPDAAMREARLAYDLGDTRAELRERLVKAGKWVEPSAAAEAASNPAAAASAAPAAASR